MFFCFLLDFADFLGDGLEVVLVVGVLCLKLCEKVSDSSDERSRGYFYLVASSQTIAAETYREIDVSSSRMFFT